MLTMKNKLKFKRELLKTARKASIVLSIFLGLTLVSVNNVSAWIGTGSGGSGGGGGGGGGDDCSTFDYTYREDCSGKSWAFYEAIGTTTSNIEFPYMQGVSARVQNAVIPAECSNGAGQGGGFWHYGANAFSFWWGSGSPPGYPANSNRGWPNDSRGWYGHWYTMNYGHPWTWMKYKIIDNDTLANKNRQTIGGVYRLKEYGTTEKVLADYQKAYTYETNGGTTSYIPGDVWGFCYGPYMNNHKITLKAILENGASFSSSVSDKKSSEVSTGAWASVTRGNAPSGYTFLGFKQNASDGSYVTRTDSGGNNYVSGSATPKETYKEKMGNSDVTRYAVYVMNQFMGRSQVLENGVTKASTGYKQDHSQVIYTINNCETSGCKATIQHHLKRTAGSGSTTYTIKRTTSNIANYGVGTVKKITTETFASSNEVEERSTEYILYPGQIVCETLIFDANLNAKNRKTTACVSANGKHVSNIGIGLLARNTEATKYASYQAGTIYAKPGDNAEFQATYTPSGDQVYYTAVPQKYSLNSGVVSPSETAVNGTRLGDIGALSWKNAFNLQISFPATFNENYAYNKGATDVKQEYVSHVVAADEVGKIFNGVAKLNNVTEVQNTPNSVNFSTYAYTLTSANSETGVKTVYYTKADVLTSTPEAKVSVAVPYNFINTTTVDTTQNETTFYAGETANIKYSYIINPKANADTTNSADLKYATSVHNPKWKLKLCVTGGSCYDTEEKTGSSLSVSVAEMYSAKTYSKSTTINIPDVPAGTEVCVQSGVYPASSGADTNYTNANGDGQWAWSEPKCFTVAKKPSIQVWGGNIYSNGIISTARATKNNLAGYDERAYQIESNNGKTVFGSWGELGVIANGLVSGLASGASIGYGANDNGTLSPPASGLNSLSSTIATGGSTKTSYCKQVPLSFANSKCTSGYTGQLGSAITSSSMKSEQSNILLKFDYGGTMNSTGATALNDGNKIQKESYYYYGTKLTVGNQTNAGGNPIQRGSIQFVHGTEGIYISGNLEYQNGYTKLTDVPKLIIYTEKDINIACGVSRIDAILIAGGTVNTCADENGTSPDVNAAERSRQLIINGAVIATKLEAKRTYGAGPGVNSGVPAEILNFDPTLYRFGEIQASNEDAGESFETTTNLDTVYQKELAPRA